MAEILWRRKFIFEAAEFTEAQFLKYLLHFSSKQLHFDGGFFISSYMEIWYALTHPWSNRLILKTHINTQHYRLCYSKYIYVFVHVLFIGIKTYKSKYWVKLCILQELIKNVLTKISG